jgi:PleD family two-component response regulator
VTASFGLAQYQYIEKFEQVIARADLAMYQAKQNGRNQIAIAA